MFYKTSFKQIIVYWTNYKTEISKKKNSPGLKILQESSLIHRPLGLHFCGAQFCGGQHLKLESNPRPIIVSFQAFNQSENNTIHN